MLVYPVLLSVLLSSDLFPDFSDVSVCPDSCVFFLIFFKGEASYQFSIIWFLNKHVHLIHGFKRMPFEHSELIL